MVGCGFLFLKAFFGFDPKLVLHGHLFFGLWEGRWTVLVVRLE